MKISIQKKFLIAALTTLCTITPYMHAALPITPWIDFKDTMYIVWEHMKDITSKDSSASQLSSMIFNTRTLAYTVVFAAPIAIGFASAYFWYKHYKNSPKALIKEINAKEQERLAMIARYVAALKLAPAGSNVESEIKKQIAVLKAPISAPQIAPLKTTSKTFTSKTLPISVGGRLVLKDEDLCDLN